MTPFHITFKGYLAPHICVRLVSTRWYMVWNEGKYVVHLPTAHCNCSQVSKITEKKDLQKQFFIRFMVFRTHHRQIDLNKMLKTAKGTPLGPQITES